MVTFREFVQAFRELGLNQSQPVIVHADLASFGEIRGGADTLLGALLTAAGGVMTPAFTYRTMVYPETGPGENACLYGTSQAQNSNAEFFLPEMPVEPGLGEFCDVVRAHPEAKRSSHPILSFAGIHVDGALAQQSLQEPFAPVAELCRQDGVVLLAGADHKANFSIHYAEMLAGRKQFVRWALTPEGIRQCPGFPGCPQGFNQAAQHLLPFTRTFLIGQTCLQAVNIAQLVQTLQRLVEEQPGALLCSYGDERCETVRRSIQSREEPVRNG